MYGEASEIAVTCNKAKPIKLLRVQQVHRVDDQRAICCILARCIGELLNRLYCESLQYLLL